MITDDIGDIIFMNLLLMIFWHLIVLILSMNLNPAFFNPKRGIYQERKWENGGRFYANALKIKKWKDKLPQFVSKNGFSKRSLKGKIDKQYVEKFIFETCRAEWNHMMGCMYFIISFCVNSQPYAMIFSLISIAGNLPFLCIQRFNRIRLCKLAKRATFTLPAVSNDAV